jgi:iron complex outermembrane recepter protein
MLHSTALAATTFFVLAAAAPVCAQPAPGPGPGPGVAPASVRQALDPGVAAGPGEATILVTARHRVEEAQKVPVSMSVVDAATLAETYTVNTGTLAQLVPTLNYSSPNPRNTSYTIRGLGSGVAAISSANDGLEPGVGFYIDQVYHARPATGAFDFSDIAQIEVLRGPQGTLFGKNTTAGAITIVSKAPGFDFGAEAEVSVGERGMVQARGAVTGPLIDDFLALRVAMLVNKREGVVTNVRFDKKQNDLDNQAMRGQLLFTPGPGLSLRLIGDWTRFRGECCVPLYFRVVDPMLTAKSNAREYAALAAAKAYAAPSSDIYDRLTDIDADLGVRTSEGGATAITDWEIGFATLTSVSAWRYWSWSVDNDRDYIGLPIQLVQRIPSRHDQYSQELRIATKAGGALDAVAGLYYLDQTITGNQSSIYGPLATYWLLGVTSSRPDALLDGYGLSAQTRFTARSHAVFAEATWRPLPRLALSGGMRYTHEKKDGRYASQTFGGLATTSSALIADKNSILRAQSYVAHVDDGSVSGRVNIAYELDDRVLVYAGYAKAQKSGGINMSGLPVDTAGNPVLGKAVVGPEKNSTFEVGLKSTLLGGALTVNVDAFHVDVTDFQANVVDTVAPAAVRTFLANIPRVRVRGFELDAILRIGARFTVRTAGAYTDSAYAAYPSAPCPIEKINSATPSCDLTGTALPGTPRWAGSWSGEYRHPFALGRATGDLFARADVSARTKMNADATGSAFMVIPGYALVNAAIGFRAPHWDIALYARNLFNADYIQNVAAQAGNSGLILATPSDPRILGITLRARL